MSEIQRTADGRIDTGKKDPLASASPLIRKAARLPACLTISTALARRSASGRNASMPSRTAGNARGTVGQCSGSPNRIPATAIVIVAITIERIIGNSARATIPPTGPNGDTTMRSKVPDRSSLRRLAGTVCIVAVRSSITARPTTTNAK